MHGYIYIKIPAKRVILIIEQLSSIQPTAFSLRIYFSEFSSLCLKFSPIFSISFFFNVILIFSLDINLNITSSKKYFLTHLMKLVFFFLIRVPNTFDFPTSQITFCWMFMFSARWWSFMRAEIIFIVSTSIFSVPSKLSGSNRCSVHVSIRNEQIKWRYKDKEKYGNLKPEKIRKFKIHRSIVEQCDSKISARV